MADYSELKAAIRAAIYDNVTQSITGEALQTILLEMVDELGHGITVIPGTVQPDISLARYVSTELIETGVYSFIFVGVLSDGDTVSYSGAVYSVVLSVQGRSTARLVIFGQRAFIVKTDLTGYSLEEFVRASMAETWTFTLADGSNVTKKVVVL